MIRLEILKDLCSPLPEIPADTKTAFLSKDDKANLRGHLRKTVGHCQLCGNVIGKRGGTLDHVIPSSKCGANTATNIVLVCRPCNQRKGNKHLEDYARELVRCAIQLRRRFHQRLQTTN